MGADVPYANELGVVNLIDKKDGSRLDITYIDGPELEDELLTGLVEEKAIGSTHPRISFAAGGGRIFKMKAKFIGETEDDEDVISQLRWLQARMVPEYETTGRMKAAPRVCMFNWGDYVSAQVVIRQAPIKISKMFTKDRLLPLYAEVSLRLDEYELGSRGFDRYDPSNGIR
jgi:hypothetical protein